MRILASIFILFFIVQGHALASSLDDNALLSKISKRFFERKDNVAIVEFHQKEFTLLYYDSENEKVQKFAFDLGLDRIKSFIIREIKKQNPNEIKTPNPLSLSDLKFASQFINTQLGNMVPEYIKWRLYRQQMLLVYIDKRLSTDLKEMICFPYSIAWDESMALNTLTENLGKDDIALEKNGFSEPKYDLIRILIGYNFFKLYGYYTSYVLDPSIRSQIDE